MINDNIRKLNRISNYYDRSKSIRLDMNENPTGLPPAFIKSVLDEIGSETLSMYPNCSNFIGAYSKYVGMLPDNILPTNGSDMAIRLIFDTFVNSGSTVLGVSPSFEMYRINAEMHGATYHGIRYNSNLLLDYNLFLESIDETVSLIVLLYPNNPTGDVFPNTFIEDVIKKAKRYNAFVLIDEAYYYFNKSSCLEYVKEFNNVIVIRTFSKLLSIAALRLGVIISNPDIISLLFNSQPSFDVNSVALLFGQKIIESSDLIDHLVQEFDDNKKYVENVLKLHNYDYIKSHSNFILICPKNISPIKLKQYMLDRNILIKTYEDPLLCKYFRINIGSIDIMKVFFEQLILLDA